MEKLLSMVNEMSDDKVTSLQKENEELKQTIDELTEKLSDIQNILIPNSVEVSRFFPEETQSGGEWEEVKPKVPMKKNHHTPSIFRGTDYRHNPVMTETVHGICIEFGYQIPKMEVIQGGVQAPNYMPENTVWNYEYGKPVHYRSKDSPYFQTSMCLGILRGCGCNGQENCSDLDNTCFYCHDLKEIRPFRKFIYGRRL
jgi:hypothetical protein